MEELNSPEEYQWKSDDEFIDTYLKEYEKSGPKAWHYFWTEKGLSEWGVFYPDGTLIRRK